MKIGIDVRLWGTKHAGIGRYTQNLVENLVTFGDNQYVLFCRRQDVEELPKGRNIKEIIAEVPHYTAREQLILPGIFKREKLDLLHVPHFNAPIAYSGRYIVTIHDVLWHQVKGLNVTTLPAALYLLKYLAYRIQVRSAIHKAEKVIVPSKAVKDDLIKRFRIEESKIAVVYEGAPIKRSLTRKQNRSVLEKYGIKKPYLLYVGNLYPHKNVETLVKAMRIQKNLRLVVVCGRSIFWERFKKFLRDEGVGKYVNLVGYVPDQELPVLYEESEAFVFPTLSEGFGLPGLEAMQYKTPVICSNIPVLREIYGDAAAYFDPKNEKDVAEKIGKVIKDEKLRSQLIAEGEKQVKKYSWLKMAQETLKAYNEVVRFKKGN